MLCLTIYVNVSKWFHLKQRRQEEKRNFGRRKVKSEISSFSTISSLMVVHSKLSARRFSSSLTCCTSEDLFIQPFLWGFFRSGNGTELRLEKLSLYFLFSLFLPKNKSFELHWNSIVNEWLQSFAWREQDQAGRLLQVTDGYFLEINWSSSVNLTKHVDWHLNTTCHNRHKRRKKSCPWHATCSTPIHFAKSPYIWWLVHWLASWLEEKETGKSERSMIDGTRRWKEIAF